MTSAEGGFGFCIHCNKKLYKQYSIAAYIFYFIHVAVVHILGICKRIAKLRHI